MKFLKKLAGAAALSFAFAGAAQAATVLNNWVLNPAGSGFSSGEKINQYLDLNGLAFIQITASADGSFTFKENGTFISYIHDGGTGYDNGVTLTATFTATGTGVLGTGAAGTGSFTFSGGTIALYANAGGANVYNSIAGTNGADVGTLIGTFNVLAGGGGIVDASGNPVSSGNVTVNAKASAPNGLAADTFFTSNGFDLSAIDILSYALTGATSATNVRATQASEIACEFAGYTANGCGADYKDSESAFFVSNSGSFKLNDVPEPGSLALFGIAMLGAGFASRKRASKV